MAEQRKDLGRQIRAARLAKKWKQKQLAAAVHVEPTTVSRWERGQHTPDIDMLELVAQATGKSLSFFVDRAPPIEDDQMVALRGEVAEVRDMVAELLRRSA